MIGCEGQTRAFVMIVPTARLFEAELCACHGSEKQEGCVCSLNEQTALTYSRLLSRLEDGPSDSRNCQMARGGRVEKGRVQKRRDSVSPPRASYRKAGKKPARNECARLKSNGKHKEAVENALREKLRTEIAVRTELQACFTSISLGMENEATVRGREAVHGHGLTLRSD
uniref:Uncharacterized protein n=1 Tax=Rhodosorus marinus TaxID=101924 RepID=A0A7S2ZFI2_9RHOD|mmetsp:Transcript_17032/g.69267  ORF Transcript_17032/g.69267 Transcript_17032/m.69267 type:complete len:170 (+) Transcript_17032:68-577(+)